MDIRYSLTYIIRFLRLAPFLLCAVFLAAGCSHRKTPPETAEDDVLVVVADSSLRLSDVVLQIPVGTSSEDSVRLFHAIVASWVDERLLEAVAVENIDDMERIENLVADYRRKLIAEAYKRKMRQSARVKVSEDSLKRFYDSHSDELVLQTPLVKGLYIKIPEASDDLADVRRWVFSGTPDDVDNIEKTGLRDAVQYDYFGDRWIEFSSLAELIPYRFSDPDRFLSAHRNFETSHNGNVYLLHISEVIRSGNPMPYAYARSVITELIRNENLNAYETKLLKEIRADARKDGRLKTPGYDLDHRLVTLKKK